MKAIKYLLAGGAGLAALAAATPASAQYYPNYGGGNVIGQVLGQILNPGYGYGNGYGINGQVLVDRCAAAVTDRVNRQFGYAYGGGYGAYGGYGGYNNVQGGARVVAITSVERRSSNRLRVRGIAQTSTTVGGYGYNAVPQDFAFKCTIDARGYINDIDLDRTQAGYGYNSPYQQYGTYRRY